MMINILKSNTDIIFEFKILIFIWFIIKYYLLIILLKNLISKLNYVYKIYRK